jgi:hypothetical protein
LFVVPTVGFDLLYALVIVRLGRRDLVWINVTRNPTAEWIARQAFGAEDEAARLAGQAARLAKADLTTDMVREFTELQGTMGGIYARGEGLSEQVWKAIYFHYLPISVEASAKPTAADLGRAGESWAAVSLADKLDTVVGLFAAGERPTGSRDPFGLRRAAQGVVKILIDLPTSSSVNPAAGLTAMIEQARRGYGDRLIESASWNTALAEFMAERESHVFERRGFQVDEVRAVVPQWWLSPGGAFRRLEALAHARKSAEFEALAALFKRVKNITLDFDGTLDAEARSKLVLPAEKALLQELDARWPAIRAAVAEQRALDAEMQTGFSIFAASVAGQMNEATIRFPSALYATLGVLTVYLLGRKLFGAVDYQAPIGGLCRWLRPNLASFPSRAGYLKADSTQVDLLRDRYRNQLGGRPLVGISWRGGTGSSVRVRSIPLAAWAPILAQPAFGFVNLQYGDCRADLEAVRRDLGVEILHDESVDPLKNLDDFAAQTAAMDLVISIDNSTVHMAGALNVPIWVMLPAVPDWRWMLDRSDSPWYPSVRLFRQALAGEWTPVIERVAEELKRGIADRNRAAGARSEFAAPR